MTCAWRLSEQLRALIPTQVSVRPGYSTIYGFEPLTIQGPINNVILRLVSRQATRTSRIGFAGFQERGLHMRSD